MNISAYIDINETGMEQQNNMFYVFYYITCNNQKRNLKIMCDNYIYIMLLLYDLMAYIYLIADITINTKQFYKMTIFI